MDPRGGEFVAVVIGDFLPLRSRALVVDVAEHGVVKRVRADFFDGLWNGYVVKTLASVEQIIRQLGHAAGNRDHVQICHAVKGACPDGGERGGQLEVRETAAGAAVERAVADGRQPIRQRDGRELAAVVERVVSDALHAAFQHRGGDRASLLLPRDGGIGGAGRIIKHPARTADRQLTVAEGISQPAPAGLALDIRHISHRRAVMDPRGAEPVAVIIGDLLPLRRRALVVHVAERGVVKRVRADLFDGLWNGYVVKALASVEQIVRQLGHAAGDRDHVQICHVVKGAFSEGGERGGQLDIR